MLPAPLETNHRVSQSAIDIVGWTILRLPLTQTRSNGKQGERWTNRPYDLLRCPGTFPVTSDQVIHLCKMALSTCGFCMAAQFICLFVKLATQSNMKYTSIHVRECWLINVPHCHSAICCYLTFSVVVLTMFVDPWQNVLKVPLLLHILDVLFVNNWSPALITWDGSDQSWVQSKENSKLWINSLFAISTPILYSSSLLDWKPSGAAEG